MSNKQSVLAAALQLNEAERAELAEALYASLHGPRDHDADQAWVEEIERRVKAADEGGTRFLSWDQARQRIVAEDHGEVQS
ncbi:MAG TPA: addiction module protein [Tepidisphaeraceae bacterium]|jgi:putative addiction module component (TIGR02574 family)